MSGKYDDIILFPYCGSKSRKRMSMTNRGAQFSPFAALTGFEEAIQETGRLTDMYISKDKDAIEKLDRKLYDLWENQKQNPEVTLIYFEEDRKKSGGRYLTVSGKIKKLDPYEETICFQDGTVIALTKIHEIHGDIFKEI